MNGTAALWAAYRLRWRRRFLLARSFARHARLLPRIDRTGFIRDGAILVFATVRNELARLPGFLTHHRDLGVDHFLIVDNASTDGATPFLADQSDVSLWSTDDGYRDARFGVDWLTCLQARYGHGHWCLTLDADELLIYAHHESRDLRALTDWLDLTGRPAMGALMLDLYPGGSLNAPGRSTDPLDHLTWFDAGNYVTTRHPDRRELRIQGGPRARAFFADDPRRAPTLSKVPLVRWNRRYAYIASTHALLPPRLNEVYATDGGETPTGALLHTKFLPDIGVRSAEELSRRQMRADPDLYDDYYEALCAGPTLWHPTSTRYEGWRQLEALGLMSRGGWE
ncbi:glycosyltransferase family 2 protein [uncultured Jannaschia sp.]|uniref:glycosyltransferase family 2 protein n=1 Tax=uncultured Jannaschia sp. TaxID=293347 RepID=UPI002603779B|nr:glycosyltransferase family 2 protein [uncultured Jannaschia sp.]